jgi:hypothetical protein
MQSILFKRLTWLIPAVSYPITLIKKGAVDSNNLIRTIASLSIASVSFVVELVPFSPIFNLPDPLTNR